MSRPRSVAVNVGANTNEPGVRGPVYADGSFTFVPIPESEPTVEAPPTYADLALDVDLPPETAGRAVHLDPEFAEYPCCERYTYGDPWGVKARPLLDLAAGDHAFFYATLDYRGDGDPSADLPPAPDWGAYLVGGFRLARDPVPGEAYGDLPTDERAAFANNAHVRRDPFDAAVLLEGDPDASGLFDRAVPLSADRGVDANRLVTDHSGDSGEGPWWRRPLRFDESGTAVLLDAVEAADAGYPAVR